MQLHKLAVLAVVLFLLSAGNHETRGGEAVTHSDIEFANVDGRAVYHDNLKIHARVLASLGIEGHWPAKLAT